MPPGTNSQAEKTGNIQLDDGWTFVRRPKGRHLAPGRPVPITTPKSKRADHQIDPDPEQKTRIIQDIEKASRRWRESGCAEQVRKLLLTADLKPSRLVCAGLGHMDPAILVDNMRCIYQFSAFMWFRDVFGSVHERSELYSQDPKFTLTDIAAQEHFDVKVNIAENVLYNSSLDTLLFAPYVPWSVLAIHYLPQIRPTVCICHDMDSIIENLDLRLKHGLSGNGPENDLDKAGMEQAVKTLREFQYNYQGIPYPSFEPHLTAFRGMTIYHKKQDPS